MNRLDTIIRERIMVLDGAMGTMIQQYSLSEQDFRGMRFAGIDVQTKGNNDMLNITRPGVIEDIHRKYLMAGADIITTNTFSSQRVSQADYNMEACSREMALEGARIARRVADEFSTPSKPRFVAGSVGPTNRTCSMSPDVSDPALRNITYDELFKAYSEQIDALVEGGVDAVLIETIFDAINAKAAIGAAMQVMDDKGVSLPLMLSVTVSDLAGRTLGGQTLDAFLASVSSYPIFSIGLNCSFGARQMKHYLKSLAARAPYYISVYPNAGLPDGMGRYNETPESMAAEMAEMVNEGITNIIGGCCGTTERFIAKFAELAEKGVPHKPVERSGKMQLSGLEMLELTDDIRFVNVGERCNVAGSRKFLRLIREKQYLEAVAIARRQVADGAMIIDINMDDALLDAGHEMTVFLNMIAAEPDIASVPVMIDSSDWTVITAALKCVQGKSIVNSISLKEGEEVFVSHAKDIMRYGAAVVVMCFDEQGQATTFERRREIAERAYKILTEKVGMRPEDIIFDPNVLAIATGMAEHDDYAADFIRSAGWIRKNLKGAHVSGGVSNLSFAFRGNNYVREAMHAVFLYHAIKEGMDFGIVNPAAKVAYGDIPKYGLELIEDVVLNRKPGAAERLIDGIDQFKDPKDTNVATGSGASHAPVSEEWRSLPADSRLVHAMVKGIGDWLDADLHDALAGGRQPVEIIEGPLMQGMNTVGELFGQGKMFLPQVVKSARTMKQAVSVLQPLIGAEGTGTGKSGRVLLATVKGDVHDIGKNIVAAVMACTGYDVEDLGVMVPAHQIASKAKELHADIVGLSGLITPSLSEMVAVVEAMQAEGLDIPVMIGGATTSEMHVALKIAPAYSGTVVWVKDASQNPVIAARLLDKETCLDYAAELNCRYAAMRRDYGARQKGVISIEEARRNKPDYFGGN